jgi:hypothetical protein
MYSEHGANPADSVKFDKESITRTLIKYLGYASDTTRKDRDYYYFLVGNCYFNMTHYGNSWMMRRYNWSTTMGDYDLPDRVEAASCNYAKTYYLAAASFAKTRKFKALALRMAGRCESYGNEYPLINEWGDIPSGAYDSIYEHNRYYNRIKKYFPECYDDLMSNCYSFDEYFNAR